jgi:two-component system sensor histidine kinase DegS
LEKYRYNILLLLFILTIIANQIIFSVAISEQTSNGKTINIAGKQRMYSQQITKLALDLNDVRRNSSRIPNISNLQKAIESFKKADVYLKQENILLNNSESINIL